MTDGYDPPQPFFISLAISATTLTISIELKAPSAALFELRTHLHA